MDRLIGVFAGMAVLGAVVGAAQGQGLAAVELKLLDAEATGYATFQSHNQKTVSNANGIFTAHIRSRNEPFTAQQWRLSRSTDGGHIFSTIYEATHATNPPALETDEQNNIYLVRPDFEDGNAYLYRFLAADDYTEPTVARIEGGSAGKYSMIYDRQRQQLYYFAWGGTFFVLDLDGRVSHREVLTVRGEHADPQYPLLSLDTEGVLHTAWTTLKLGVYLYWDIHYMASPDGGLSWQKMDGTSLQMPVPTDDSGDTDRITLEDEFEVHTWLSSFLVKDGKAHFAYMAQTTPYRQHYMRYDIATGAREFDLQPGFGGTQIELASLDGFFASRSALPNAPLYYISSAGGRVGCLASDDNGETWYDYAVHEFRFNPYSFGGARELTADGQIVGAVTDFRVTSEDVDESQVHFIRIQAGLSRARIARMDFADGVFSAEFEQIRGQPQQVRFRTGEWGGWMPFEQRLEMDAARAPDQFQLRSRLGVESEIFDVGVATAIEEGLAGPSTFALDPNYPNPFNSGTVMRFSLPIGGHVDLSLYNLAGQKVTTLVEGRLEAGVHSLRWDGRDKGRELASGVYLYRLQAGGQVETRRLLMLR